MQSECMDSEFSKCYSAMISSNCAAIRNVPTHYLDTHLLDQPHQ